MLIYTQFVTFMAPVITKGLFVSSDIDVESKVEMAMSIVFPKAPCTSKYYHESDDRVFSNRHANINWIYDFDEAGLGKGIQIYKDQGQVDGGHRSLRK